MIKGDKVALRAIEKKDLPFLRDWRNKEDYRCFFREYREIGSENQIKWFENIVVGDPNTIMFSIVDVCTGELLGCCGLCYINWVQKFADLSLYIGKDGVYIDDEGIACEACSLLFDYAFDELGLHKIWTEIYEFDDKKNELYRALAFEQDGLLRENYFHQGKWWNSRILSLLDYEWRSYLKKSTSA